MIRSHFYLAVLHAGRSSRENGVRLPERELSYDDIVRVLQSTIDSRINSADHSVYCKPEAKHHNK